LFCKNFLQIPYFWFSPELRFLGDRKGTPLPGYLRGTLPSAAAWGVEMLWGFLHSVWNALNLLK